VEKRSIRRDDLLTPEPAADADVALVHTAEYVGKIKSGDVKQPLRADRRTRQAPEAYIMETQRNESGEVLCVV